MDKKLLAILKRNREKAYNNSKSILKKYDKLLESRGVYRSLNSEIYRNNISGHIELCDGILKLYEEAQLENERIVLLEDLRVVGYDESKLVELILKAFFWQPRPNNLWEYAELLYSIKNYNYIAQYLSIIKDASYEDARQMLVLLIGKSKKKEVVPILKELLEDTTIYGHALEALSNFSGKEIDCIMRNYLDCDVKWIRKIAEKHFSKRPKET